MFVKKVPAKGDERKELIITRAMGVRVPPKGAKKVASRGFHQA